MNTDQSLLASERMWDETRMKQLAHMVMPFGKYKDVEFCDIPLAYFETTIAEMKPSWIVRRAAEFVDLMMESQFAGGDRVVPIGTLRQLLEEWSRKRRENGEGPACSTD